MRQIFCRTHVIAKNARIEQCVITEQAHMVATAGGQPQRRKEAGYPGGHMRDLQHAITASPAITLMAMRARVKGIQLTAANVTSNNLHRPAAPAQSCVAVALRHANTASPRRTDARQAQRQPACAASLGHWHKQCRHPANSTKMLTLIGTLPVVKPAPDPLDGAYRLRRSAGREDGEVAEQAAALLQSGMLAQVHQPQPGLWPRHQACGRTRTPALY